MDSHALQRRRLNILAGPAWNVIDDQWHIHFVGYCGEVAEKAFLGRFVIVGSHLKTGSCTQILRLPGHVQSLGGIVGSCTGDNRDAPLCLIHNNLDDANVFPVRDGGAFAGSPHRDDTVDSRFNLGVHQAAKSRFVHGAVVCKRCNQCCIGSFKHHVLLKNRPL